MTGYRGVRKTSLTRKVISDLNERLSDQAGGRQYLKGHGPEKVYRAHINLAQDDINAGHDARPSALNKWIEALEKR